MPTAITVIIITLTKVIKNKNILGAYWALLNKSTKTSNYNEIV